MEGLVAEARETASLIMLERRPARSPTRLSRATWCGSARGQTRASTCATPGCKALLVALSGENLPKRFSEGERLALMGVTIRNRSALEAEVSTRFQLDREPVAVGTTRRC
jgi:hypothetical protein